jgi:general secretion pathway protein A
MYTSYFGFKENPFNLTPDPRYLFLSPYHKEALDHLLYGINERKGFIAITGGIGTGKTTLCRALLSHLDPSTKSALILNAFISDMELLKAINQEFGIPVGQGKASKKEYIDTLNQFLLRNFARGGNAVLLIDESQNLSDAVLEQIRMLSNLETEREKLIQIVLVGQSELKELLAAPSLRQLNERITVRYDLSPLEPRDIRGYVEHRLVVAGGRGNVRFTDGGYRKIALFSNGNPRRINAVCDRSLLIAYVEGVQRISKATVRRAIAELHRDMRIDLGVNAGFWRKAALSSAVLLLLMTLAGFAGWRLRAHLPGNSPVQQDMSSARVLNPVPLLSGYVESGERESTLFLDEKTSLAGLFGLSGQQHTNGALFSLVVFDLDSKYYEMLRRPFRIHLSDSSTGSLAKPSFLLIREITGEGAIAMDAEGKAWLVTRDFVLSCWGSRLSWVYAHEDKDLSSTKGMDVRDIVEVQRSLSDIGYAVAPTGVYDDATIRGVKAFQEDLGLKPDGVTGFMTRALLYQMTE